MRRYSYIKDGKVNEIRAKDFRDMRERLPVDIELRRVDLLHFGLWVRAVDMIFHAGGGRYDRYPTRVA